MGRVCERGEGLGRRFRLRIATARGRARSRRIGKIVVAERTTGESRILGVSQGPDLIRSE